MVEFIQDNLTALLAHPDTSDSLKAAMSRSSGSTSYRCALQVNPFGYTQRHAKSSGYDNEQSYNNAMVEACRENDISVVALTDHFRTDTSKSLAEALVAAGVIVFPGFEANSSEGIHLLCIFPPETDWSELNLHIGACGVDDLTQESPQADKSAEEIAKLVFDRGGITIAAHACSASGLLTILSGKSRARVWRNNHIIAAAIAGDPSEVPQAYRQIIMNKDPATKRNRPMALINANDVSNPTALGDPSGSTFIKMSEVSIEGLRQAFLDAESRVRLNHQNALTPHTEVIAVSWDGGLFDGQSIRFNEGLNVLIGGRGSGKSTVIESLRYVFDIHPRGKEANQTHKAILKNVLGAGSEISVLIHSPKPSPQFYLIKRIYDGSPRVFDENGQLVAGLKPLDVAGDIEIYGQHEISELTRKPDDIANILRRFVSNDDNKNQGSDLKEKLDASSLEICAKLQAISVLEGNISPLPTLREQQKRFESMGLAKKLKNKKAIDNELSIFELANELVNEVEIRSETICKEDILYDGLLEEGWENELPNPKSMAEIDAVHDRIIASAERATNYLNGVVKWARRELAGIKQPWELSKADIEKEYNQTLRDLKKEGHDGSAYISIQDQITKIIPKEKKRDQYILDLDNLKQARAKLLASFESETAKDFRDLKKAAKKVGRRLSGKVRVVVDQGRDLETLNEIIRKHVPGQINQAITKLAERENISLTQLASVIRSGAKDLEKEFGFSKLSAEKIAEGGELLALEIEQHKLPPEATLSLNVGSDEVENWKSIDQLSTGQKATAVLLLLLLESDAPVVIDQPEDDLDNRFIVGSVISAIRKEKQARQFLFSSHNANIPVLGDAEQIVKLEPVIVDGVEYVEVYEDLCGSIDAPKVKDAIKVLLEGGKDAFEYRREKYGF